MAQRIKNLLDGNQKPVYELIEPIDALTEIYGTYTNTHVWDDNCHSKSGVTEDKLKYMKFICNYTGNDLPSKDELCEYIYSYIDGGDGELLGNTVTHTCTVEDDLFCLDIVAKNESGEKMQLQKTLKEKISEVKISTGIDEMMSRGKKLEGKVSPQTIINP